MRANLRHPPVVYLGGKGVAGIDYRNCIWKGIQLLLIIKLDTQPLF